MNKSALTLALAVALTGCSLAPDYQRPESGLPERWTPAALQADAGQVASVPAAELGWQGFFRDARLQQLIGIALENNRDLRVATLNVEAFRAQYRVQRADLLPSVSADAAMSRTHTPAAVNPLAGTNTQYSATLGLSWELDLFGRVRSLRDQALEQYFASEAAQRSAKVSLVAAVANAWLALQADQALLQVASDTLKTYEESLTLTQRSYDVGVASALDLSQARTAVESTRGALATYTRLVAQGRNALTQLLGGPVPAELLEPTGLDADLLAEVPAGLPSDLLRNRPDILQAEHQLRAANANIGAARAAFFPRIGLTGAAGFASGELSDLFGSDADYWSFTPSISVPIFNAGRLRANRDYAEVAKNIQVAQYEKAIQTGFREVADGLAARATYSDQVQAQRNLLAASEEYYQLAERRYRGGVDSYLNLLVAQRQLFAARQGLVGDRLAQLISEVDLYKALGGGWLADEPQS
ncbi:MAG TPA: efflux transporter outer membrane subunit [Pseudomonas sp.]|uniref:efflux transporter outer membrane subunit n=1 Tax=Pseudomonas sp. TaxID=306 RepID=UPI002C2F89B5|nr:efflux transporter outer membrane subunit [Pseudomonas sp.]HTO19949.1 efflux transporter outer membrane subunit [Pseudomonas sp.]